MSKKAIAPASSVGVRELKNQTSAILRRMRRQETLVVTDRNRPVAVLVPVAGSSESELLSGLARLGRIAWSGGKPTGSRKPPAVRGPSVADAVIEDRR